VRRHQVHPHLAGLALPGSGDGLLQPPDRRLVDAEAAGTFKTLKEARTRRDYVAGEIAAGRNPRDALRKTEPARRTLNDWFELWLKTRIDVDERTRENYRVHWKRISPKFGSRAPDDIEHAEIQEWINEQTAELTPAVVRDYLGTFRQIVDQTGVEPNPARHRALRLPTAERPIHSPPSDKHVLAMLDRVRFEYRLLFVFLEQTGARLGETLGWRWGDVDHTNMRILSRPENVKGRRGHRRARWVQVPDWLFDILLDTCPPDDRNTDRRLFEWPHDVGHPRQKVEKAMAKACKTAGIPHYHPHDLRHRRITLWHGQGIPAREIGERVGQRQVSTTLDIYTHVMPLDEVPTAAHRRLLVRTR
jgi:integrase